MMYADIIVDISHEKLDRSFQYRVPQELESQIHIGMVVSIPFGNGNHERRGYVIGLSQEPKLDSAKIKPFKKICRVLYLSGGHEAFVLFLADHRSRRSFDCFLMKGLL